jgi:hypothetical protein
MDLGGCEIYSVTVVIARIRDETSTDAETSHHNRRLIAASKAALRLHERAVDRAVDGRLW